MIFRICMLSLALAGNIISSQPKAANLNWTIQQSRKLHSNTTQKRKLGKRTSRFLLINITIFRSNVYRKAISFSLFSRSHWIGHHTNGITMLSFRFAYKTVLWWIFADKQTMYRIQTVTVYAWPPPHPHTSMIRHMKCPWTNQYCASSLLRRKCNNLIECNAVNERGQYILCRIHLNAPPAQMKWAEISKEYMDWMYILANGGMAHTVTGLDISSNTENSYRKLIP